jgi:methionyl-tRNA formyltransferase
MANDKRVMKFIYCGYDFMLGAARRLIADGHELAGVLTFPCDNVFNFNAETLELARETGVPVLTEKPRPPHIEDLIDAGARCFFAAGYLYKIPPIDETRAYGVNLHPSLLPLGRGIMPVLSILMRHPEASGLTLHKLAPAFDAGEILAQENLAVGPRETVESLSARMALRAPDMVSSVMADLTGYWAKAKPQDESKALHFPPPDDAMRLLDWAKPVEEIDRTARAFGRYGSLARFDDALWAVYAHDVWKEKHGLKPGAVALRQNRMLVIAAADGFVCLKDFQPARL